MHADEPPVAARSKPVDGEAAGGAVANQACVAQPPRFVARLERLAAAAGWQDLERHVPQGTVGHDHQFLHRIVGEIDPRILEEQPLDPLGGHSPIGGDEPFRGHGRRRVKEAQGFEQTGDLAHERTRLLHIPGRLAIGCFEDAGEPGRRPMKRENDLARPQPPADLGRGQERRKRKRRRLPATRQRGDDPSPRRRGLPVVVPLRGVGRESIRCGPLGITGGATQGITGAGHRVDRHSKRRVAGQDRRTTLCFGDRQGLRLAPDQGLDRRTATA